MLMKFLGDKNALLLKSFKFPFLIWISNLSGIMVQTKHVNYKYVEKERHTR